jgi:AcrR family transcriptional regulator
MNPDEARSRLMDAAITCLQRYGMEKTGLGDIASAAGVTKPTIYAYFENRDDLLRRALIRSGEALRVRVVAHAQRFESPADRIVEAILFALRELPNEPVIAAISPGPSGDFAARHALRPYTVELTSNALEELLEGQLPDADELAEVLIRWSLSLLVYQPPKRRSEAQLRSLLHRRMIPGLGLAEDRPSD